MRASVCLIGFVFSFAISSPVLAKDHWTELNIGPFYVDTQSDPAAARDALNQLEQLRWVLGGLLESKDLPSTWPIRVMFTQVEKTNPTNGFVSQGSLFVLVLPSGSHVPLDQVARILIDANTPRLPPDVESGLPKLFSTLEAHGSRVAWGGRPAEPDLAWARMRLFATKFEYGLSFHIFLTALKGGSSIRVAERNAFGKDPDALEAEAQAMLASHDWQPVSVSGRPLDPKRDFGEHTLDPAAADAYLADWQLASDPKAAEAGYKSAIQGGAQALGFEGLAQITKLSRGDPEPFLQKAIQAGSKSAPVYVAAADGLPAAEALPLLKKAAQLNPLWAEPIFQQAQLATDPAEKLGLFKKAAQLGPRDTRYWLALAHAQTENGQATAAQGTWLRAEDSAPTDAERQRIHQLRLDSEEARLQAAENDRKRERDAVHLADQQAQQAEADRIHQAEQRANQSLDEQGGEKPADAVPFSSLVPNKKLQGSLIRVECIKEGARLSIRDRSANVVQLLLPKSLGVTLPCTGQQPARRITASYNAKPDDSLHTAGEITSFQIQ